MWYRIKNVFKLKRVSVRLKLDTPKLVLLFFCRSFLDPVLVCACSLGGIHAARSREAWQDCARRWLGVHSGHQNVFNNKNENMNDIGDQEANKPDPLNFIPAILNLRERMGSNLQHDKSLSTPSGKRKAAKTCLVRSRDKALNLRPVSFACD